MAKAAPTATSFKEMSACSSASRGSHGQRERVGEEKHGTAIRARRTAVDPRGLLTRLNLAATQHKRRHRSLRRARAVPARLESMLRGANPEPSMTG